MAETTTNGTHDNDLARETRWGKANVELHSLYRELMGTKDQSPNQISQRLEKVKGMLDWALPIKTYQSTMVAIQNLALNANNSLVRYYTMELVGSGALATENPNRFEFSRILCNLAVKDIAQKTPLRQRITIAQARSLFQETVAKSPEIAFNDLAQAIKPNPGYFNEGKHWASSLTLDESPNIVDRITKAKYSTMLHPGVVIISRALICHPSDYYQEKGTEAIKQIIAFYGLDPDKTFADWVDSYKNAWDGGYDSENKRQLYRSTDFVPRLVNNFTEIDLLRAYHPKAPGQLQKFFNISDFDRYPRAILEEQFSALRDAKKRYCLLVYPQADWNGAFYLSKQTLYDLHKQLKDLGYLTRVAEARNIVQLYSVLAKSDQEYNSSGKNRIAGLVIGGHGQPDRIEFGPPGPHGIGFLSEDIFDATQPSPKPEYHQARVRRHLLEAKDKFIAPSAPIVLVSCSTGKPESIGSKIAQTLKTTVSAPEIPTHISDFKASEKDGQLFIYPVYQEGPTATFVGNL